MSTLLRLITSALLAISVTILAGCGADAVKQVSGDQEFHEITIASAASMKPALDEIAPAFEERTGHQTQIVFSSSGLLARQIESQAPYNIYLSANKRFMAELEDQGKVVEGHPYARGTIVLIGKAKDLKGLTSPSIKNIAIANPKTAPYGEAAKEALENAGVWADIQDKVVFSENVAQAYEFVSTKNADAAIVALSQVKTGDTDFSRIKQGLYEPIEQWAGIVAGTESTETARAFLKHLHRKATREILQTYGFEPMAAR